MALEDRIRLPTLSLIHRRPRLLNILAGFVEARQRLITIYAPSGYGKSIILADFAQTTDLPVCWCSLVPADRDPTAFLNLLAYSIIDRFREIEADHLLRAIERGDTQTSIRRIAEALAPVGSHIIIIDDYHKAVSAGMTLALNKLLELLPDTTTVIVAARGDMILETGQIIDLLLSERVTGVSEEELSFTGEELQRVMRKRFGQQIDLESAEEIARATHGNIAQILLTGHMSSIQNGSLLLSLKQRLGDDQMIIYHYLANEVFDKQSPELQRFMLHTSVLPDMTAELCNAHLEINEAQNYLEELVRRDLFISQTGASFKYHDLFAEFLRARLAKEGEVYRQVVSRAARLLSCGERTEEGINLYLSIQAWDKAAALLETHGRPFYDTGRALTLHYWLGQIPEAELAGHPRLLLLRGQILNDDLSAPGQAMMIFRLAEKKFQSQHDEVGVAVSLVWQAVGLRMMGQARESLDLATRGLSRLEDIGTNPEAVAYALRQRGLAHGTAGNIIEAIADLRRALELYEQIGDTYRVGMCHHDIGVCLEKQGNISSAEHHFRQAVGIWEMLGNANDLANTLNSLGVCSFLQGNYEAALEQFNDSLQIAQQIGATRRAAYAQAGMGDTYLACQDYVKAGKAYTASTELAQEAKVQALEIYNLTKQGECAYKQGNLTQAFTFASRARDSATETGLDYERGLACVLQAKLYTHWKEFGSSFDLFAEAVACLDKSDVSAQAAARLWWAYSLLLNLQTAAAIDRLQEAMRLILTLGEALPSLRPTLAEVKQLLFHFLHWPEMPDGWRESLRSILDHPQVPAFPAPPDLQVFAFGPPLLVVDGEKKQFNQRGGIRRTPEFLLYLILVGQKGGCRWSDVCAALWPEEEPEKASILFHQHLKRLRKVILENGDYIVLLNDYYQVNTSYLTWCDALAFDTLYERAVKAAPDDALSLWLELIALYRGDFLAGFELGEWGTIYRTSYEDRFLQAIELAGERLLQNNTPGEALIIVQKGLDRDYFREALHRRALRAYAQLGMYDNLSTHYHDLQQTFTREFDAPPESETIKLYEHLMKNR